MNFIINLLISALVVFALSNVMPGVAISGYGSAIIVALVIGFLTAFVRPILGILTLSINFLINVAPKNPVPPVTNITARIVDY